MCVYTTLGKGIYHLQPRHTVAPVLSQEHLAPESIVSFFLNFGLFLCFEV